MKLYIPLDVWQQMRGFCLASNPNEITGIGTIKLHRNHFFVDQIFIPQQKVCPGYCESDNGAINEIIFNVVEDNPARAGDLRFRWHSHASSDVFWSSTDEQDIDSWKGPWAVNLVMNVRDDCLARLDVYDNLRLRNIPLDISIIMPIPADIMEQCRQEVAAKTQIIRLPASPQEIQYPASRKNLLADYHDDIVRAMLSTRHELMKGGDSYETK